MEKAFAAGADIKEMKDHSYTAAYNKRMLNFWGDLQNCTVPTIAAVSGFALGGGFELAMQCDIIYCGTNAKFGLVECTVGTIPGCGGTQRLIREVGKSRAMEMILTGEHMLAEEALSRGLVAKVFEPSELVDKACEQAKKVASMSKMTATLGKDAVNMAYELPLQQGLQYEKRNF